MGDLFVVVINAMLYVVLFVLTLQLNRKIGVSEILLSIYVVVAFFCVIHFLESPSAWNLSLFNLVYLFLVFCIFFVSVMSDENDKGLCRDIQCDGGYCQNKPGWCPLKELPERRKYGEEFFNGDAKGWNDCLKTILGENKNV